MNKSVRAFLSVSSAALLSVFFFCSSALRVNAQDGPRSAALDGITAGRAEFFQGADLKDIKSPPQATVSGDAQVPGRAAAIEPGKGLLPEVRDEVRTKAILQLVADIYSGKHLPYSQDGVTFLNKEGRLPAQPKGFYKEYTLITGSAPHTVVIGETTYQVPPDQGVRGSERVVIGNGEKLYYSPDHYGTFVFLEVIRRF